MANGNIDIEMEDFLPPEQLDEFMQRLQNEFDGSDLHYNWGGEDGDDGHFFIQDESGHTVLGGDFNLGEEGGNGMELELHRYPDIGLWNVVKKVGRALDKEWIKPIKQFKHKGKNFPVYKLKKPQGQGQGQQAPPQPPSQEQEEADNHSDQQDSYWDQFMDNVEDFFDRIERNQDEDREQEQDQEDPRIIDPHGHTSNPFD